jgi:exopolysaccharide production protein ExoY
MREFDFDIERSRNFDRISERRLASAAAQRRTTPTSAARRFSNCIKYVLDVVLASTSLILLFPMILMVMAILLVVQGRPIFIAHKRIGKNGVMFQCLKFRSMVNDAQAVLAHYLASDPQLRAEWDATRKLQNDPRVTPFGQFMRKSSIDEIPQLLNIVCGQMSLVGPRPIVASEAELYGPNLGHYTEVRPGLTGLWQVSGRSDTSYVARVELDVRYVTERTTWGDISIMFKTIPAVLQSRGSY